MLFIQRPCNLYIQLHLCIGKSCNWFWSNNLSQDICWPAQSVPRLDQYQVPWVGWLHSPFALEIRQPPNQSPSKQHIHRQQINFDLNGSPLNIFCPFTKVIAALISTTHWGRAFSNDVGWIIKHVIQASLLNISLNEMFSVHSKYYWIGDVEQFWSECFTACISIEKFKVLIGLGSIGYG